MTDEHELMGRISRTQRQADLLLARDLKRREDWARSHELEHNLDMARQAIQEDLAMQSSARAKFHSALDGSQSYFRDTEALDALDTEPWKLLWPPEKPDHG